MRVLVCGSRNWSDPQTLWNVLRGFNLPGEELTIISGMAPGADTIAAEWARANHRPLEEYPADWQMHSKAAGPIRNQQMLNEGKPELVLAFIEAYPSPGTEDMVRRAKAAGVPTYVVSHAGLGCDAMREASREADSGEPS